MQPAAARVGPSNEPSVRRIAVRFSSGATICIEKTIKVRFFPSYPRRTTRTPRSSSQEARQVTMRTASNGKDLSKQRARKSNGRDDNAFRRFLSSETSEETPKFRSRLNSNEHEAGCFRNFYVADLSSNSFRTSVVPFLGPVLASLKFVGRLIGSNFRNERTH